MDEGSMRVTVGMDVGDKYSELCVLDASGEVVEQTRIRTSPQGMRRYFGRERGWRVAVQGASEERLDALDAHLWTYKDDGFLPHGTWREPDAAEQPVLNVGSPAPEASVTSANVPQVCSKLPSGARCWIRLLSVSATYSEPSAATARARGAWNCPGSLPTWPMLASAVRTASPPSYGSATTASVTGAAA